ncbi:MAG: hypothetical protein HY898_09555 [Deltaproteobacteria bacterium]|nr:hypothetical protein [Deltaproteobacteria bacterium]
MVKAPLAGGTLQILSEQTAVSSIAVAGGWVYWTDNNLMQLTRIPIGGGTAEVVATGMKSCTGLVRDASNIYWSSEAGIWRLSLAGTGQLKLATSLLANQRPMAVDGDYVYWFATDLGSILRVPK